MLRRAEDALNAIARGEMRKGMPRYDRVSLTNRLRGKSYRGRIFLACWQRCVGKQLHPRIGLYPAFAAPAEVAPHYAGVGVRLRIDVDVNDLLVTHFSFSSGSLEPRQSSSEATSAIRAKRRPAAHRRRDSKRRDFTAHGTLVAGASSWRQRRKPGDLRRR